MNAGGLCLASAAIHTPESAALASLTDTSWESEDSTGHSDKVPVLAQTCRARNVVRPRTFYLSLGSGSERHMSRWKGRVQANRLSPANRSA
jgi:hypothetical protein